MSAHAGTAGFTIAPTHPALPGHFPGTPIVPGVLLLAEAMECIAAQRGTALACGKLVNAKFLRPVLPGELVTVDYQYDEHHRLTLALHTAGAAVAQARFECAPLPTRPAHG